MVVATRTATTAVPTIVTSAPGTAFPKLPPRPKTTLLSLPYEVLSLICESLCPHCTDSPRGPPAVSVDPGKSVCLENLPALAGAQRSCRTLCYLTTPLLYHRVGVSSTRGLFHLARFLSQRPPRYARGVKELRIDDSLAVPRPLVSAEEVAWLESEARQLGCGDLALRVWDPVAGRTCGADNTTLVGVLTDVFLSRAAALEELYLRNPYHLAQLGRYLAPTAQLTELALLDVAFGKEPLDGGFDLGTIAPLLRRAPNIEYLRTFTTHEDPLAHRNSRATATGQASNGQALRHDRHVALDSDNEDRSRFHHSVTADELMDNAHRHDPLSSPNAALPSPILSPQSSRHVVNVKNKSRRQRPQGLLSPDILSPDALLDDRHRHDPLSSPNAALPSPLLSPTSPSPRRATARSPTSQSSNTAHEHRVDPYSSPNASLPSPELLAVPGVVADFQQPSSFSASRSGKSSDHSAKNIITTLSHKLSGALDQASIFPSSSYSSSSSSFSHPAPATPSSLRSLSLLSRSLTFLHLSVPDLRPTDLRALVRSCPRVETLRLTNAGAGPLTGGPGHARNYFAALLPLSDVLRHLDFDAAFSVAQPETRIDAGADDDDEDGQGGTCAWAPHELASFDALELLCLDASAFDPFVDVRGAWGFPTGHGGMLSRCLPPGVESVSIDRVPAGWTRDLVRLAGAVGRGKFDMMTHFYYVPADGEGDDGGSPTAADEMVRAAFRAVGVKCRPGWVRGVSRWMWKFGTD